MNDNELKIIQDINQLVNNFKTDIVLNINDYSVIKFIPPEFEVDYLHPETKNKFITINSIPIKKGIYGPFYRYSPKNCLLIADNDKGGYFTISKIDCYNCAKRILWLYDKNRECLYKTISNDLFRFECFFVIEDDFYSTIFVGEIAYGDALQIRPNNWIFGNDTFHKNKIYYKFECKLSHNNCNGNICKKSFEDAFEK